VKSLSLKIFIYLSGIGRPELPERWCWLRRVRDLLCLPWRDADLERALSDAWNKKGKTK
jgi:hypothetical protein